jgi:ADP-ribose pyrophosphatase YjhB (NUDIX family)
MKQCGWIHWGHTPTTVATIITNPNQSDQILLVRRGGEPFKDLWSLPAGFTEYGELPESAALREAKEEVNLTVQNMDIVGQYLEDSHPKTFSILTVFRANGVKGEPSPADDAVEASYFPWNDLPEMAFVGQVHAINDHFGGNE